MKKLIALVLALAMVALCVSAFADTNNLTNDGTITVENLMAGDTVYYYQVLEWDTANDGTNLTGWKFTSQFADLGNTNTTAGAAAWAAVTGATGAAAKNTRVTNVLQYITGMPSTYTQLNGVVSSDNNGFAGQINSVLAGEIGKLAATPAVTGGEQVAAGGTSWSKSNVPAGLYLVLVAAGQSGYVYNPIFVASDYYNAAAGGVPGQNNTDTWSLTENTSYSDNGFAKKKQITVSKTTQDVNDAWVAGELTGLNKDSTENYSNDEASTSKVGDIVKFTVTTTIPVYASNYADLATESLVFNVFDNLSNGLALVRDDTHPVTVLAGAEGSETDQSANCTITAINGATGAKALEVDFANSYIKGLTVPASVIITYYAKITDTAVKNVNAEKNTVTVEYSNDPNDLSHVGVLKDESNHYTFSLDADALGIENYETSELVKVGLDKDGNEITATKKTLHNGQEASPLQGAKFGLYTDEACTTLYSNDLITTTGTSAVNPFTTDANGKMNIKGLDVGTYYLREVSAPDGYIPDTTVKKIVITAEFEQKNVSEAVTVTSTSGKSTNETVTYTTKVLKSYSVTVGNVGETGVTSTYTMSYVAATGANVGTVLNKSSVKKAGTPTHNPDSDNTYKLLNKQGTQLPSTGGIGTTIFYIVGGLLVIGAAVVLVARRKASN